MKATLINGYVRTNNGADVSHLSEQQRANLWVAKGEHGSSSLAIWSHMVGAVTEGPARYPHDPADLNRCLLLLAAVPEWKCRMHEMSGHGEAWALLAAQWDELTQTFIDEVGLNWVKGTSAPKTYALMKGRP